MLTPPHSSAIAFATSTLRSKGVRRALVIVLLLNALSAALKISVGARTGALTVLGAALESVLDMLSNVVANRRRLGGSALAVNFIVVIYERRRGRMLSSPLLLADAAHTASDISSPRWPSRPSSSHEWDTDVPTRRSAWSSH